MQILKQRGTRDLYNEDLQRIKHVSATCLKLAQIFGFNEVVLPIFEASELFHRNNESSDVVKKELYEFKDRGNRAIALRPEATASIMRMIGENKLLSTEPLPLKLFTFGSMFRYERPQKGRLREFNQFDVEVVGGDAVYDVADVIHYGAKVLETLGLSDQVVLKINFLGAFATRAKWKQALIAYLEPRQDELSAISQERLHTNPLRILDDKVDGQLDFVKNAPKVSLFLSKNEKNQFQVVLNLLDQLNLKYEVVESLVRGLDYYTDTVFEFVQTSSASQQDAVISGGQYDGLVQELTGADFKGIGLAVGIDRCAGMLDGQVVANLVNVLEQRLVVINLAPDLVLSTYLLVKNWQANGVRVFYKNGVQKIDKAIKLAQRLKCRYLGIIGSVESKNQTIQIKDLAAHSQQTIKHDDVLNWWLKTQGAQ